VRPGSPLSASVVAYPGVPINPTRQFPFTARLPNRAAPYVLYEENAPMRSGMCLKRHF